MRQYAQIKAKYPGALLLFRVGDFYETFGEDAVTSARILGITLTKRGNGSANEVELAGFPHHSLDNYLPKLVRAGQRVAICDQLEDPKTTKKIVKRGVTELVTPGVTNNDKVLESRESNYLCAVHQHKGEFGLAFLDVSTGEFLLAQGKADYADKLLQSLRPSEIILAKPFRNDFAEIFGEGFYTYGLDDWTFGEDFAQEKLRDHFGTKNLKGFGVEEMVLAITAAGASLHYLEATHHHELSHISSMGRLDPGDHVWLDRFTIRNLELLFPSQSGGKALVDVLDETITPMGARLLRKWVIMPLKDHAGVVRRQSIVEALLKSTSHRSVLAQTLQAAGDLERLVSKIAFRKVNPRELLQLKRALEALEPLIQDFGSSSDKELKHYAKNLNALPQLSELVANGLNPEAPVALNKGEVIRSGFSEELDELRKLAYSGKDYLAELQQRESTVTGISSLKVGYNNVFGYYLEVTHAHKSKVPTDWIRKQTLVNAERYITSELKEYEEKIMGAEEKIRILEAELFSQLVESILPHLEGIQQNARVLAELDCLLSFATISESHNYVRPEIEEGLELSLMDCRHPVIERMLKLDEPYIPNDIYLNNSSQQLIILTGPNMSGKSAILRQTALAVIMAQMGCFVAAKKANIGLVDKVFTRVGASDNISGGESTFMVEMMETASILNNLSDRSLILLDEIGRGTSTYDGVSLAWSIAEFLNRHETRPKTLFATHYHELNELEQKSEGVINYHVSVKESDGTILFLRKMRPGGSEHSFGIHVAKMAGVPKEVLARATDILHRLEADRAEISGKETFKSLPATQLQMFQMEDPKLKEVLERLQAVDVNTLTPIEAMMKLNEVKQMLEE